MSECPACGYDLDATVSDSWEVLLHHTALSGNSIGSSGRGSKGWQYRNERKRVSLSVGRWTKEAQSDTIPTKATAKRRVWITRLWGNRQRAFDMDNLIWGLKGLVDEIKVQGWILEDSPKYIERIYSQEKSLDGVNYILIRIEDIKND